MKRPPLQYMRVGVLRMAYLLRNVFGTFEKTGPWTLSLPESLPVKYFPGVLVFRIIIIRSWMIYALTNVNPCFGNAVMNLQTDRQPDKELDQKPCK